MIDSEIGTATGFKPVPEPSAILILGSSLLSLGVVKWMWGRRA